MFPVGAGVHQGSALSPLLLILVMDYISKQVGGDRSKKLQYADDVHSKQIADSSCKN